MDTVWLCLRALRLNLSSENVAVVVLDSCPFDAGMPCDLPGALDRRFRETPRPNPVLGWASLLSLLGFILLAAPSLTSPVSIICRNASKGIPPPSVRPMAATRACIWFFLSPIPSLFQILSARAAHHHHDPSPQRQSGRVSCSPYRLRR